MQTLELLLITLSSIYLVFSRFIHTKINRTYLITCLLALLSLQLLFEGIRWQMIPAYIIWLLAIISAIRAHTTKASIVTRIFKIIGLVLFLSLAIVLPSLFPIFKLPKPTGTFTVGTTDLLLELDKAEPITNETTDNRRLMIKVWYPSNETADIMDLYVDQAGRNGFAQKYGLPSFMMQYLDKIKTSVYRNIPIAEASFPVLIFSHGYHSKANGYYA